MLKDMSYAEIRSKTRVIDCYDVLISEDDEVLIALPVKVPGSAKEGAAFYYSGGKHGFLIKNHRTVVLCGYLNDATHDTIYKNDLVLIAECILKESATDVSEYQEANLENADIEEYEVPIIKMDGIDELAEKIMKDKEKEG